MYTETQQQQVVAQLAHQFSTSVPWHTSGLYCVPCEVRGNDRLLGPVGCEPPSAACCALSMMVPLNNFSILSVHHKMKKVDDHQVSIRSKAVSSFAFVTLFFPLPLFLHQFPFGRRRPCDIYWHAVSFHENVIYSGLVNKFPGDPTARRSLNLPFSKGGSIFCTAPARKERRTDGWRDLVLAQPHDRTGLILGARLWVTLELDLGWPGIWRLSRQVPPFPLH